MSDTSVRWAIIGTGHIARKFASDLRFSKTGRLTAVGSRQAARATAFAEAMGDGVTGGETAAVLGRDDVDAVYVATPNDDHVRSALQVLAAGKPVLIEKPVAVTPKDARTIREAASKADRLAMEAMWILFTPGIVRLRALVAEGRIGDPVDLSASLSYARDHRDGDKLFDPRCGGALLDLGVYPVSLAQHLFGAPDEVTGIVRRHAGGSVRQAGLTLRFGTRLASISCGFEAEGPNRAVVTGTRGFVSTRGPLFCPPALAIRTRSPAAAATPAGNERFAPLERPARLKLLTHLRRLASAYRETLIMTPFEGTGLQYQADHFAECLRKGLTESPVHPLSASEAVLATIEAVSSRDQAGLEKRDFGM